MDVLRCKRWIVLLLLTAGNLLLSAGCSTDSQGFVLVSQEVQKKVYLSVKEPGYVQLAAKDLVSDIKKITGRELQITHNPDDCKGGCVIIGSVNREDADSLLAGYKDETAGLQGKWEAYRVKNSGQNLIIAGSDERGTMFGIYDFTEKYLGVDPLYFWSDREPEKRAVLEWKDVNIDQPSPTFKYRGWFINDEDLLTEWYNSTGRRHIDYPYYHQVVSPDLMRHMVESLVRLRMNLIIPASFIDIFNAPEAELVKIAASRGVFISMHHIEPMGVSAFSFFNYWEKETGRKPTYSFYSNPDKLEKVWRIYADEWNKYPNVVWQIGLRGVGDRPMWTADSTIPQSNEARGRLISKAMAFQMNYIKKIDRRPSPPVTTTLWMEGSALNSAGYLKIPRDVTVVLSDNSPGWKWQDDFYHTEHSPANTYGIYYHEALWGSGPHLAQAIPPAHTYHLFKEAYERDAHYYAILNVSNIRPFQLGEGATAHMLYDFKSFDPERFETSWMTERFGAKAQEVKKIYDDYFKGFVLDDAKQVPMFLDGLTKRFALKNLGDIKSIVSDRDAYKRKLQEHALAAKQPKRSDSRAVGDMNPQPEGGSTLLSKAKTQQRLHLRVFKNAEQLLPSLDSASKRYFETNLLSQLKIMLGMEDWLVAILEAKHAVASGDLKAGRQCLNTAKEAFKLINEGKSLNTKGAKWHYWYRGDKKLDLVKCESATVDLLDFLTKEQ